MLSAALLAALLASFLVAPERAAAGLIIKLPSNLGLSTNLVGHWTMDASDISWTDGNIQDKSGNANKGSFSGAMGTTTAPVIGKVGQALKFDGSNDYIDVTNESNFDFDRTNPFSISAWIYSQKTSGSHTFLSKMQNSGNNPGLQLQVDATNSRLIGSLSGTTGGCGTDCIKNTTAFGSISPNIWYHIVMTYDGSSTAAGMRLYIGGVDSTVVGGTTISSSPLNNQTLIIGQNPSSGGSYFDGKIDDVRIYSRALSASEIRRLYNIGGTLKIGKTDTASLTSGLVGHWTFDGTDISWTDNTVRDRSTSGNNGAITNMSTTTSPSIGRIGQALKFDGSNDIVVINNDVLGTGPRTIAAWIYPKGQNIPVIENGTIAPSAKLWVDSANNRLSFSNTGASEAVSATNSLTLNTWQLVTVVRNSSDQATLYINGVQSGTANQAVGTPTAGETSSYIGANFSASAFFDGLIDDVRIYSRALAPSEIRRLYNMGGTLKIGKTDTTSLNSGLVGHWTMDAGDISWTDGTIQDKSTGGNKGSFNGAMSTTTAPVAGRIGQALKFDGSNDYVNLGSTVFANTTQPFTVSYWAKINSIPVDYSIPFTLRTDLSENWRAYYTLNSSVINFGSGSGWAQLSASLSSSPINTWHHVVITYNGNDSNTAGNFKFYDNGVSQAIGGGSFCACDTGTSRLGMLSDGVSWPLNGSLDDVRVYSRALSASEIQRLYQMGR